MLSVNRGHSDMGCRLVPHPNTKNNGKGCNQLRGAFERQPSSPKVFAAKLIPHEKSVSAGNSTISDAMDARVPSLVISAIFSYIAVKISISSRPFHKTRCVRALDFCTPAININGCKNLMKKRWKARMVNSKQANCSLKPTTTETAMGHAHSDRNGVWVL